ncbi:C4-dicarboxylate ABC transporter permease [Actibacterium mucosum KCTC 23349]|uniref:TRAP transporter small permease protein n=1 Tax=Actibacterium mucosum KCTC 23349 TaxID=1454373 RepID=A0A037ZKB7_9RHOB|nr:TRAP transporter small permease [Actibacterium mucosum]KAJ55982.1 C4-dicarboxylate ABC transporter permease [Actibacterium mucosum KCTC 23349]
MHHTTMVVNGVLRVVIIAAFAVLVACVTWQVFSRYVLGTPSTVTDEMARFLFIWVALLGGAYTLGQRRHLAIDLLSSTSTGLRKRVVDLLIITAIAGFAGVVMIYGGLDLVARTLKTGQVSPALRLPMGYVYIAIPFAGSAMLYYCVIFLIDLLRTGRGPTEQLGPTAPGGPLD